ncbi:hypothetical protein [Paraburkholderia fungorum]|jgi:hypothetical protein|uniref:hypothetical protein n=1 Tax=Paraburkholderia fungorum TaxID=134537 RepID=UPI000D07B632|nr:hypothetical protein [Paraburkholderia fungorum]PRZ45343.1 hypothetical protein BX589_13922 [Paraburkholderia fungorum]
MNKAQLKADKEEAYEHTVSIMITGYMTDNDDKTDFITVASGVSKRYEQNMRVYGFLYRNRHDIRSEALRIARKCDREMETGDY